MSSGPIYRFSGEFAWASNFDESDLHLKPNPVVDHVPVTTRPAWMSPEGYGRIAELTASVEGLIPRVVADGLLCVPGVERPFQAWKTDDVEVAARILGASTPAVAKKVGQPPERGGLVNDLRSGWANGVAVSAMLYLSRVKYSNESLHRFLVATGYRLLVEGNTWSDTTWGAVWSQPVLPGQNGVPPCWGRNQTGQELRGWNWLGRTLNLVRAEHHMGMRG